MPQNLENTILNPVEFTPELPEIDLSAGGLYIGEAGPDWGEGSQTVERVKQAIGEGIVSRHWPSVECAIPLWVGADREVTKAQAYGPLEAFVGELQRGKTLWVRRDFSDLDGFAGSVGCPVDAGALTSPSGFQANEILLKLSRSPIWYATSEILAGEAKGSNVRDLQLELAKLLGTAPGLIRVVIKNEGAEDWRGCSVAIECDDFSSAATAKPKYEATQLTPNGGAEISASIAPEVRAVGTVAAGVGAISPGLPAGTVPGDLLVMVGESGGAAAAGEANTVLTAAGWLPVLSGSQKKGNTRLSLLYRIAEASNPTTTNDTGDHQMARIIGIKAGTFDPTAPFNAATETQALTKAVSIPGATTTRDNCLIVACACGNLPDSTTTAEFSAVTNASLTGLTERIDNTTAEGDGGAIFAATGVLATHGTYAATTVTAVTEAERACISMAINPLPEFVKCPPLTAGWTTVLSSKIAGAGHMTHLGARRMVFRLLDPSVETDAARIVAWEAGGGVASGVAKPEPKQVQWKLEWRALGAAQWIQTIEGSTPIVAVSPTANGYQLVDLGEVRPERAITGEQRWEWRLRACSPGGANLQPLIRDVYVEPNEQRMRGADATENAPAGEPVKSPATAEDATGVGTIAWSNPSNVLAVDEKFASAENKTTSSKETHYLKVSNFGFTIPSTAVILGISVAVQRRVVGLIPVVEDGHARIVKGGVVKEVEDKAKSGTWPGSNLEANPWNTAFYGGGADLWGQTWLPSDINSSGFGFAYSAKVFSKVAENEAKAEVDAVTITVAYGEVSASENHICFASRSIEFTDSGVRRQHVTDEVWGELVPQGFAFSSPPQGQESKPARVLIVPTVGDFQARADSASVSPSAKVYMRSAYLFAREAAE